MPFTNPTVLCRYHYDALDRFAACSPAGVDDLQRFYQKSRLSTEIQGQNQRSIMLTKDQLLAQLTTQNGQTSGALLATDQQRSVLAGVEATQRHELAYMPYGFHPQRHLPGFNGEQPDPVTGHYLLGNGYRAFNPLLMRFNSPDSLSPFGEGGINAYAYCGGDPVNFVDPTGHTPWGAFIRWRKAPWNVAPNRSVPESFLISSSNKPVRLRKMTPETVKSFENKLTSAKTIESSLDEYIKSAGSMLHDFQVKKGREASRNSPEVLGLLRKKISAQNALANYRKVIGETSKDIIQAKVFVGKRVITKEARSDLKTWARTNSAILENYQIRFDEKPYSGFLEFKDKEIRGPVWVRRDPTGLLY